MVYNFDTDSINYQLSSSYKILRVSKFSNSELFYRDYFCIITDITVSYVRYNIDHRYITSYAVDDKYD